MFKLKYFLPILLILLIIPVSFANDNVTDSLSDNDNIEISIENNDTIYVSKEGNDTNVGDNNSPVATISKAITLAGNKTSHKIIVNEGEYFEYDLNITSSLEIIGKGNVTINANRTTGQTGRIFTIDTTDEVKISGITFKNGREGEGGAILINHAKVTIDKCIFQNNTAVHGGAMYWNGNNGTLSNSIFSENRGRRSGSAICWGGISEEDYENYGDNGIIVNITIDNNDNANSEVGESMGLAIYSNNVIVSNSSFINNHGHDATIGGSLYISGDNITVDNCLFENNTMDQAPAIQCNGNNAKIINSKFINNSMNSQISAKGGAIDIRSTNAQIYNNTFINNGGENCYNGGAISITYIDDDENAIISILNNKFINNSAVFGGGIFIDGGAANYCEFKSIIINNNSFDGCEASTTSGIYVMNVTIKEDENVSTVIITNNEFKNLIANYVSSIFIDSASVKLENNTMINCISLDKNNNIYNNGGYISGDLLIIVNNNDTIDLLAGRHIFVNATLFDNMGNGISGGNLTIIVEGQYISEDGFFSEYGTISIDFYSTEDGIYTISADYLNGDMPQVKTSMIISLPYEILINFNDSEGFYGEEITIPVQVAVNGELLDNENITVTFNDEKFNLTVNEGIANINLKLPKKNDTYNLTVTYDIKDIVKSVLVKDNSVILYAPNVNVTPYSGNLKIILKDMYDNLLYGENITVSISNTTNTLTTDENGEILIALDLDVGLYTAFVNYTGSKYKSSNTTSTINVSYIDVILTGFDVNMNYNDGTSYIVRLTDINSKALPNQNLSVKICEKNYQITTDENGVATLLINFTPNSYAILTKYNGNNIYNPATINNNIIVKSLEKLTANNINMYFTDKNKYKVRLYGIDGKAVGMGNIVKIIVNGKTYNLKTDKNGYASFTINLNPNTYRITAYYGDLKISNKIIVKPILFTKNISKKKAKKIKFSAKLSKGKKAIVNKKIKFKFKGKTYNAKTNKKGIATITLKNLKVGKHIIYTIYSTSKIKNIIKIKK